LKTAPRLPNGFIINEEEYLLCKEWLDEANQQTVLHPLEDADLEIQRRRMKSLVEEYEANWRSRK
jgi:hypothetical protein